MIKRKKIIEEKRQLTIKHKKYKSLKYPLEEYIQHSMFALKYPLEEYIQHCMFALKYQLEEYIHYTTLYVCFKIPT